MSLLPGATNAVIPDAKITRYLLDANHSIEAAGKAKFFTSFGFTQANWQELKRALLDHVRTNQVASRRPNALGENHVVTCSLMTPDGRNPCIDAVWFIDPADPTPHSSTAYPHP